MRPETERLLIDVVEALCSGVIVSGELTVAELLVLLEALIEDNL